MWLAVVVIGIGATGMGLVGAELATRHRERHLDRPPGSMPSLFYQHMRLRHAMVRNHDYFSRVYVNRHGMRGREVAVVAAPDVFRIMIVGSSTTFDPQVSGDEFAWPARLEHWLEHIVQGVQFEVLNAGVPGYVVLDNLIRLQAELYQFRPDLLIVYEGHNDLFGALRRGLAGAPPSESRPDEIRPQTPWQRWLTRESLLYGKVAARLAATRLYRSSRRASRSLAEPVSPDGALQAAVDRFERDLVSLLALAQRFELPVAVAGLVHITGPQHEEPDPSIRQLWSRAVPFAPPEVLLRGYRLYDEVMRRAADRFVLPYVATEDFDLVGVQWYATGDPIHFNDRGADAMARAMARSLISMGLVPAP